MKNSFNRATIAIVANGLKKLGMTLSQAFKMAWAAAKSKVLNPLTEAIKLYCPNADATKLAALVLSGNFVFTKLNGEIRFVANATIGFVHVEKDFCKFTEITSEGVKQNRTFKISTLNF